MPKSEFWKCSALGSRRPNFKVESFVLRVGDWGGYMLMDCDDPLEVHKFCSMLPAFEFQARQLFLSPN
jgi:muconolactone delta-isomerase